MKSWGSSEGEDDVDLEGPVEQVRGFEPAQAYIKIGRAHV